MIEGEEKERIQDDEGMFWLLQHSHDCASAVARSDWKFDHWKRPLDSSTAITPSTTLLQSSYKYTVLDEGGLASMAMTAFIIL